MHGFAGYFETVLYGDIMLSKSSVNNNVYLNMALKKRFLCMKLPFARCELYHLYATRAAVLANQSKPLLSLNPTVSCPCQWLPFVYLFG